MAGTQLTCPHCQSTLSFGGTVSAGTTVECLICMRPFAAANPVTVSSNAPATPPKPAAATPDAKAAMAILSGAAPAKEASATAEKASPAPPPKSKPTVLRAEQAGTHPIVIVLCVVLVAVLAGGLGFTIWKINDSARGSVEDSKDKGQIASNPKDGPSKDEAGKPNADRPDVGKNEKVKPVEPPPPEKKPDEKPKKDDDADIKVGKGKQETKPKLERKDSGKSGGEEPKFEPIEITQPAPVPIPANVPGLTQQQINATIDKGVAYLRQSQGQDGSWTTANHAVGYAALGGLTLLECNVPANDPAVQRAAQYLRANAVNVGGTYETSCAILFLDRLGEARDRALIQGWALRLMSGQEACGGWNYGTNAPSGEAMYQLYKFLHANKQPQLLNPLSGAGKPNAAYAVSPGRPADDPFQQLSDAIAKKGIETRAVRLEYAKPFGAPFHLDWIDPGLRKIPVVENQSRMKKHVAMFRTDEADTDNSNTQFAILALWAARRHDVPTDYAILTAYRRFIVTQNEDGGWGYARKNINGSSEPMTCAGLLALAMGHGAAPEFSKFNPQNPKDSVVRPALQHAEIQRGLKLLSGVIKAPVPNPAVAKFDNPDLYLFWSIERVAMLYDLKQIDGKDWYAWGAQIVVRTQAPHGGWDGYTYPGSSTPINTCFALMFLRRTNLVQDLTQTLRLHSGIRDKN
jgi:hypothetical protein